MSARLPLRMPDRRRNGRLVRSFSPVEDKVTERLRLRGWSQLDIAQFLGRSKSAVQKRLEALARAAEGDD